MAKWFNWAGGGCERGLAVRAMEPCDRTIARMLLVSAFGEHTLWMIFSEWCSLSEFQSGSHTIDIPLQFIWPIQHTNTSTKSTSRTSMYSNKRLTWKFNVWNSKFECISIPICSIRIFSIRMFLKFGILLNSKTVFRTLLVGRCVTACCVQSCSMQKVMTRCWNQSARNNLVWPN